MRTITLLITYYGFALFGLANPVLGLLFFVHITIFRPENLVWENLAFGRLHLISACFVLISYLIHRSDNQNHTDADYQRKNIHVFACFIMWLLIVTVFAKSSVQLSFDKTVDMIKIFVLCFLFTKLITTESRINLYVWVTSISYGMLSFWGFLQGLLGNPRLDSLTPGGSNALAAQLALIAPVALAKVIQPALSQRYKAIFLACTLSMVLCTIYSESRAGFLGLSVGMFVFILQIRQRFKMLAVLALVMALVYPWIPGNYTERITSIFVEKGERDESAEGRLILWKIALRIWQDYPIAGVGLENFSPVKETYADKVSDIVPSEEMFNLIFNRQRYPHGLYQGMLAETGLVGLALLMFLLLRNMFCRFPSIPIKSNAEHDLYLQARGAQAGLIGFAIATFFGDYQYIEMLYLQLFFVGAVRQYSDSLADSAVMKTSQASRYDFRPIGSTTT